jgi:hypothetical protein
MAVPDDPPQLYVRGKWRRAGRSRTIPVKMGKKIKHSINIYK